MGIVVAGSIVLALLIAVLPGFPHGPFPGSLVMSLLVVIFGFFFVTVSSRIVGIIGTSSNPISGMTIATLMATCVVFVLIGRTGEAYQPVALCVGALVCIAAANAGATSQDLKTGFLVGATPRRQQIGFIIGVLVSTLVIGGTLFLLDSTYREIGQAHGIGGAKLAAPQATLMATIIKGLLAQNLPWAPVLVGVFLAFMAQMAGAHALSWAVGAYLPLATTFPIFIGGMMKALADKMRHKKEESELSSGMLYATGLVAGGSLGGVLIALVTAAGDIPLVKRLLAGMGIEKPLIDALDFGGRWYGDFKDSLVGGGVLCAVVFGFICLLLVRNARKDLEA
jgi:putative OPT family oligopeptide transporter